VGKKKMMMMYISPVQVQKVYPGHKHVYKSQKEKTGKSERKKKKMETRNCQIRNKTILQHIKYIGGIRFF